MTPQQLIDDLIREIKDADPLDRQKIGRGYARIFEIREAALGKEWYDRFIRNLPPPFPLEAGDPQEAVDYYDVKLAAKKASGLDMATLNNQEKNDG